MNKFMFGITVLPLLLLCTNKNPNGPDSANNVTIYEHDGGRPAEGALVKFFEIGAANNSPCAVYTTDNNGRFPVADLPVGRYDLWAEKDSFVLFQGPVVVSSSFNNLHDDTLEPASTLTGVVAVQYPDDPRTVTVRVEGTDKLFPVTDEKGSFTLTGLTGGTWSLLVQSSLPEYLPSETTYTATSGLHDTLSDTLRLFSAAIPFVFGIRISQDTLAGTVHLSWDKTSCIDKMDYVVYKATCSDVEFSANPDFVTTDTFLIDSIVVPVSTGPATATFIGTDTSGPAADRDSLTDDDPFAALDSLDTIPLCFRYRIAVRNREQQIGPARGYTEIHFSRKGHIATMFSHHVGYPLPNCDSASVNDTVAISLDAKNLTRSLRALSWYDPVKDDTIAAMTVTDTATGEIRDTVRYAFDTIGTGRLIAVAVDDAGTRWCDTVSVKIVNDVPVADAGNDTGVFTGTTVLLHGSAADRFGSIDRWKWKVGSGAWTETADSVMELTVPPSEEVLVCSLAVIDDDGNGDTDAVKLFPSYEVQQIAMSRYHDLILKSDGTLWASGSNEDGQLGDGTMMEQETWVKVMENVKSMSAGTSHSLIVTGDGTLWACGSNWYGQLGDGINLPHPFPVPIMSGVERAEAGYHHSLILKTDSTLWACGENDCGQLGDGTTENRYFPVRIMTGVQSMSAGDHHSLILKTNGTAWACGGNDSGQIGLSDSSGPIVRSLLPEMVMIGILSVDAGYHHSFFLKNDKTLWACGANSYGQLGDGTMENRYIPIQVMSNVHSMAAGGGLSLIITVDGTLLANGWNYWGGYGTWEERYKSEMVTQNVMSAAASYYRSLILKTDGSLWWCNMQNLNPEQLIPFTVSPYGQEYYEEEFGE